MLDCVNHNILLDKLTCYGIYNTTILLLKSYLENRKQKIKNHTVRRANSFQIGNKCGIPQSSILGPLLFPLYINDIPLGISSASRPMLYADDSSILIFGKNIHNLHIKSVTVLYSLSKWFTMNGLSLIKVR